jgi:hypothetical protein
MTFIGRPLVKQCLRCGDFFCESNVMSGNTFGAIHWSDGKVSGPYVLEIPALGKCPHCKGLLWLQDAPRAVLAATTRVAPNLSMHLDWKEEDYSTALASDFVQTRQQELFVRNRWWWAINDGHRGHPSKHPTRTPTQHANMEALAEMFSESNDEERLLRAELARELGQQQEAARLLSREVRITCAQFAQRITELLREGSRRVEIVYVNG